MTAARKGSATPTAAPPVPEPKVYGEIRVILRRKYQREPTQAEVVDAFQRGSAFIAAAKADLGIATLDAESETWDAVTKSVRR